MKNTCACMWKWPALGALLVLAFHIGVSQPVEAGYDIYAMDVKSGTIFQVSHIPDRGEYNPSWSPNGKFIVHDVVDPFAGFTQSLGITNVETGETTMLTGGEGGNNAVWSPDGRWIAFDLCPGFGHGCDPRIFVVPSDGGEARLVANDAIMPGWSPNGKRIVFSRASDGSLHTIDVSGENEKPLLPYSGGLVNPKWSPDGQWVAFELFGYLFRVRVDITGTPLGDAEYITGNVPYSYYPTWSNNSKTIVFGANGVLWSVPATGGTPTQLETFPGNGDYDPAYSNNGQYIAFAGFSPRPMGKIAVSTEPSAPSEFLLAQNYPNPANPSTIIRYGLPSDAYVTLSVFNSLGQQVVQLVNAQEAAGYHEVKFDGSGLASGVYFYRLTAGYSTQTKKLLLVR